MNLPDVPAEASHMVPGVLGSFFALGYLRGTWLQRLNMFGAAAALSYYAGPAVATRLDMNAGLAGFLVGLFGMTIVASFMDGWRRMDIGGMIDAKARMFLGLPPKKDL